MEQTTKKARFIHWECKRSWKTKLYCIWKWIRKRCNNKNDKSYHKYWWRWIIICNEWDKYLTFKEDMWASYQKWLLIDRINNDWDYNKDNCRWVTSQENCNNTRQNKLLEYNWQIDTMANWCRRLNLNYKTIKDRIYRGWSTERAFKTPCIKKLKQIN